MRTEDFTPGQGVTYQAHPDAKPEPGTVVRTNSTYVFVKYDGQEQVKATSPEKLTPMGAYHE